MKSLDLKFEVHIMLAPDSRLTRDVQTTGPVIAWAIGKALADAGYTNSVSFQSEEPYGDTA